MRQRGTGGHRPAGQQPLSLRVTVDNQLCHLYGFCVAEAPELFDLSGGQRLQYTRELPTTGFEQARSAARCCPMRTIQLSTKIVP
jgi:sulfoxide reductase heme-binding subunit YedZ